jgi:predicted Fe-Mo cluster-binding NifX family protein
MKVAISTDGDYVSEHFGRCPHFTIADIQNGTIVSREIVDNPGHHPGYLPRFLHEKGAEYIIAGGMGMRARMLFNENDIETVMGITGKVEEVLNKICNGTLEGGESLCMPGSGKGYGLDKTECDHDEHTH